MNAVHVWTQAQTIKNRAGIHPAVLEEELIIDRAVFHHGAMIENGVLLERWCSAVVRFIAVEAVILCSPLQTVGRMSPKGILHSNNIAKVGNPAFQRRLCCELNVSGMVTFPEIRRSKTEPS